MKIGQNTYEFSLDEIYGVDFGEFCKRTYTSPDLFIKQIEAELAMLKERYNELRDEFRETPYKDERIDRLTMLLIDLQFRIDKKEAKLKRYKEYKARWEAKND